MRPYSTKKRLHIKENTMKGQLTCKHIFDKGLMFKIYKGILK